MIIRKTEEVEAIEAVEGGAVGVKMRVLLGEPEGVPNFVLRYFHVEPGGASPRHSHTWEHEVYVLEGGGSVFEGDKEHKISPGDAVLVPPNQEHQFKASNTEPLVFLCIIPKK